MAGVVPIVAVTPEDREDAINRLIWRPIPWHVVPHLTRTADAALRASASVVEQVKRGERRRARPSARHSKREESLERAQSERHECKRRASERQSVHRAIEREILERALRASASAEQVKREQAEIEKEIFRAAGVQKIRERDRAQA